jgi:pimeloyl-ACP methyl ester carboxylesterase
MLGDRDIVRADYAVEMAKLLPNAQLAILPGSDHFAIYAHPDWILSMSTAFLIAGEAADKRRMPDR